MCVLVHHIYEADKDSLFCQQILFMRENLDSDFYCLYNFKSIPPTLSDLVWIDSIERMRRSGR